MIVKSAQAMHYQPRAIDDKFSALVFDEFINILDPEALILSLEDIEKLKDHRLKIDDQITNGSCNFVNDAKANFETKLQSTRNLLEQLKEQPLDYSVKEAITYSYSPSFVSAGEWKQHWRKRLKLKILSAYFSQPDSAELQATADQEKLHELQREVVERELCRLDTKLLQQGETKEFVGSQFLKAVAHAFDPHTSYFTPVEENAFNDRLSAEALSYGFEVHRNQKGEIEIYHIAPGSPAWKSNALNEGDVILAATTSAGPAKDFTCLPMQDVMEFISSAEVAEAEFRFRKKNGREMQLSLHKEKVTVEENVIQSYLLEGDRKIGYIYLPSFYTDMRQANSLTSGCAHDVAKELIKLKREGIEGLIFDLRDNGGGAMMEALRMAGIFINYGALAIDHNRDTKPHTLKDVDRGTIYNGKLVVMINSFSASASELFAAAMQDQNRAVLVGSSSLGKATSQEVLPIDVYRYFQGTEPQAQPEAFLKMTTGAFYRVTGQSHQKHGVQPDVDLPGVYKHLNMGESSYASALDIDSISKKTYYFPANPLPLEELRNRSASRVAADSGFAGIKSFSEYLPKRLKGYEIPLAFEDYRKHHLNRTRPTDEEEASGPQVFSVQNPSYLNGMSSLHEAGKELNENARKEILEDLHIRESYFIIKDLIDISKN